MKNKDSFGLRKIFLTGDCIKEVVTISFDFFNQIDGKTFSNKFHQILIQLIERHYFNFKAVSSIWMEFEINSKNKFPIFMLLRPLLEDFIIFSSLIDGIKNEKQEFSKRWQNHSASSFKKLKKTVTDSSIPSETKIEFIRDLENRTGIPLKDLDKINDITPFGLIKRIKSVELSLIIRDIYNYYFYLSQLQHFSELTVNLEGNDIKSEENLVNMVKKMIACLFIYFSFMGDSYSDFSKKVKEIANKFENS